MGEQIPLENRGSRRVPVPSREYVKAPRNRGRIPEIPARKREKHREHQEGILPKEGVQHEHPSKKHHPKTLQVRVNTQKKETSEKREMEHQEQKAKHRTGKPAIQHNAPQNGRRVGSHGNNRPNEETGRHPKRKGRYPRY